MEKLVYSFLVALREDVLKNKTERKDVIQEAIDTIALVYDLDMDSEIDKEKYLMESPSLKELVGLEKPVPKELTPDEVNEVERLRLDGNAAISAKKYRLALSKYTEAINIDKRNAILYSNRAAAYMGLEKYKDAIVDCKKALELDPSYERAKIRLANAESKIGKTPSTNQPNPDLTSKFQELMSNPAMAKLAENIMSKHNVQDLMKNLDPKLLSSLNNLSKQK